MMQDDLRDKVTNLNDQQLVDVLTKDRDEYAEAFLTLAIQEAEQRNIKLIDQIVLQYNGQREEFAEISDAVERLKGHFSVFDIFNYFNKAEENLVVQKAGKLWILHHHTHREENVSFFCESLEEVKEIVGKFLSLRTWEPGENNYLYDWEILERSDNPAIIESIAGLFNQTSIPYILNNRYLLHFNAIIGNHHIGNDFLLLVPGDCRKEAEKTLDAREKVIADLYKMLSEAEEAEDQQKQLTIYEQLEKLVFDDSAVHFNKGLILLDQKDYKGAADAVIRSLTIDLAQKADADEIAETAEVLEKIRVKLPDDLPLLHCLAMLAANGSDVETAMAHYQKILSIDPDDSSAHMNLGYLYYENETNDDLALKHFRRFLKLVPEGDEAEGVRQTLTMLGESE